MNKRKTYFYGSLTAFLVFTIGFSFSISILVGSLTKGKWSYLDRGFQTGMVELTNNMPSDKSFNEATMDGANSYAKYNKKYYENYTKIGYLVPIQAYDFNQYQDLQEMSFDNGTEFIGATGFSLLDSVLGQTVYTSTTTYRKDNGTIFNQKYKNNMFLFADDWNHSSSIARNVVSVRYEAEEVGFAAGVAASVYTTAIGADEVSTYGGLAYDSVFNWMSGYEQGINWFNYAVLGYDLSYEKINEDAFLYNSSYSDEPIHLISGYKLSNEQNTGDSLYIDYDKATSQNNADLWYTGSFDIGDGVTISAKQLDAGSKVIFPVAAGQMVDTLNQISIYNKNSSQKAMAIGVDADASKQYSDYEEYILGSATKNIQTTMIVGLWYIDKFIQDYNFVLPENHYEFEEVLEFMVSTTPEEGPQNFTLENGKTYEVYGWKEYNTDYTSRDYATMSDEEVKNNYQNDKDPMVVYSDNIAYEEYGEQYPEGYGSELVGNYENGGCNFIASSILEKNFEILLNQYNEITSENLVLNFFDFLDYALNQNPIIEISSNTFSSVGGMPITLGMHDEYPWIPDWNIYRKN